MHISLFLCPTYTTLTLQIQPPAFKPKNTSIYWDSGFCLNWVSSIQQMDSFSAEWKPMSCHGCKLFLSLDFWRSVHPSENPELLGLTHDLEREQPHTWRQSKPSCLKFPQVEQKFLFPCNSLLIAGTSRHSFCLCWPQSSPEGILQIYFSHSQLQDMGPTRIWHQTGLFCLIWQNSEDILGETTPALAIWASFCVCLGKVGHQTGRQLCFPCTVWHSPLPQFCCHCTKER